MLTPSPRPDERITMVERRDDCLVLQSQAAILTLAPKSAGIIRVTYAAHDAATRAVSAALLDAPPYTDWRYDDGGAIVTLRCGDLTLRIDRDTASIAYFAGDDRLLLAERAFESKQLERFESYKPLMDASAEYIEIDTPDGKKRALKSGTRVLDKELFRCRLYLDWQQDEALFGLGQHEEGVLNLRGTTQYLHQANMKIAVPMLVSSKGYGLLVDACSPMIFQDTQYGSYLHVTAAVQLDYYVINGGDMDGVVRGYRYLTGKAIMPPKWALGFMQSQERYENADELMQTVREYRRRGVGIDGIVLDWMSWPGEEWGQKTFDESRFPDPSGMMEALHAMQAKLVISVWPNMASHCANYAEMHEKGFLLPGSDIYDAYNPEARKAYWHQAEEGLFAYGIDGWWCDSSEPVTPEWNHAKKPDPAVAFHEFAEESANLIPRELSNAYGLYHTMAMHEGQTASGSPKRVFNLTRNAYTGAQRYGAIVWSGDTYASWDTLKKQIVAGLQYCACGLPYWTLDIGAFFVKKGRQWLWNGAYEEGCNDAGYRELFTRWYQYGAFLPVFRVHGTDTRRELWHYGEAGEPFYDAMVAANRLRYRLMPTIYAYAAAAWRDDASIMRMLAFDFAHDEAALRVTDQFMFGTSIMVCPVTQPMYYEAGGVVLQDVPKTRAVYLPACAGWFDFYTGEALQGGQTVVADAPIDRIPLYVRAGSILATGEASQHVAHNADMPLTLTIYPGADARLTLYEDDGDGFGYQRGDYGDAHVCWNDAKKTLSVRPGDGKGKHLCGKTLVMCLDDQRQERVYGGEAFEVAFS